LKFEWAKLTAAVYSHSFHCTDPVCPGTAKSQWQTISNYGTFGGI